jgi:arabinan endo-1,5-alpha-L-arabinosidase
MGRSRNITGPYLSKNGDSWVNNRYSLLMAGDYDEPGRGHNGFFTKGKITYIVYHAYNRVANGTSLLRISPLYESEDGWPSVRNTGKFFRIAK